MSLQRPQIAAGAAVMGESHVLGMAEMGFAGLSEQWLMRRAGDLHWRLIARAMGQRDAVFTCSAGKPLYAAFCMTSLRLEAPRLPQLGSRLDLEGRLWRIGHSRLASELTLHADGRRVGVVRLVSAFVGRTDPCSNRSILRRAPRVMVTPPEAPEPLQRLARRAAQIAGGPHPQMPQDRQRLLPCPATDFNAAGLLYFPSYAALTDRADFARGAPCRRLLVARDVVYLGNVEPGEPVGIGFRPCRASHLAAVSAPGDLCGDRLLALLRSRFIADN